MKATVVCDIIMLYALEERKVYKKSIVDDELRSANMAIAQTAFALVNRAVSNCPVADPEIVVVEAEGWGVGRGYLSPRGRGMGRGLYPSPEIFFQFWTSKWPVSVHCGCRWEGCNPPSSSPRVSATVTAIQEALFIVCTLSLATDTGHSESFYTHRTNRNKTAEN